MNTKTRFIRVVTVFIVCLICCGGGWNGSDIDALIRRMQASNDPQERLIIVDSIARTIDRPTTDQVRLLSGSLRADRSAEVRCAIASLFGEIARQRRYRIQGSKTAPEIAQMLKALRECLTFEQAAGVRICAAIATGEFNSNEAAPILALAKSDINSSVRDNALRAERHREQRLREGGQ